MKRCIFCVWTIVFCGSVPAQTINWYVDGTRYQTSSCTSGDGVTPPTAPERRGYTFTGWSEIIVGSWTLSGVPTADNPIYPTFYQDGDLILRAVGAGADLIADSYEPRTGIITRRVGVKVFYGRGDWNVSGVLYSNFPRSNPKALYNTRSVLFSHNSSNNVQIDASGSFTPGISAARFPTAASMETFCAEQYAAGTPVTAWYPLATPVQEVYTPSSN